MKPLSMLNGHPNRNYVPGVEANTGPLGHGLPIAVGVALAGKIDRAAYRVFVITGDGELQEGSNWEAAMAAGHHKLANLTLIVDRNTLQQGARVAETNDVEPLADKFRAFRWDVVDVDGHDPGALLDAFAPQRRSDKAAVRDRPHRQGQGRLVHGRPGRVASWRPDPGATRSGHGGIEPLMSAAQPPASNLFDCRDAFAATLDQVAERDDRIVIVVNDSVGSSKLGGFRKRWPERTINVGIAEQNMVGVGSGLANGGKIPFVSAASCFLTARALEQIKADVAYTNANVKLVGQSPGVGYGELGPTHHSIEDMAWLRLLPNLAIVAPSDPWETAQAVEAAAAHEGPVFLRITRFGVPKLPRPDNARFEIGKAETLREGADVAIIACGVMVTRALEAADRLAAGGVSARVVNMASIAPLDEAAIRAAADLGAIVTVEEHSARAAVSAARLRRSSPAIGHARSASSVFPASCRPDRQSFFSKGSG